MITKEKPVKEFAWRRFLYWRLAHLALCRSAFCVRGRYIRLCVYSITRAEHKQLEGGSKMARKRRSLNYWETGKRDSGSGERFARIGGSLLRHPAFLALPYSTRFLYICMIEASKGEREFSFPQSVFEQYGYTCQTFARGKAALIDGGFIELVESGRTTRTPNKYRFCEAYKTR